MASYRQPTYQEPTYQQQPTKPQQPTPDQPQQPPIPPTPPTYQQPQPTYPPQTSKPAKDNKALIVIGLAAAGLILYYLARNKEQTTDTIQPSSSTLPSSTLPSSAVQIAQLINNVKSITIPTDTTVRFPIYVNVSPNTWTNSALNYWTSCYYPNLLWWIYDRTSNITDFNNAKSMTSYYYSQDTVNWDDMNQYQLASPLIKGLLHLSPSSTEYTNWKNKAFQHTNKLLTLWNSSIGAFTNTSTNRTILADSLVTGNLLLIWAYKNSISNADKTDYLNKLKSHANVIIRDNFKSATSGSVWQRVYYNVDGSVYLRNNHQTENQTDLANPAYTWCRAQGWFMYGMTELYEFAQYLNDTAMKDKYLTAFSRAATFWIDSLDNTLYSDSGVMKNTIGMTTGKYDTSGTAIATAALLKMYILTVSTNTSWLTAARLSYNRLTSSTYYNSGKLIHGFYAPWAAPDTELIWGDFYLSEVFDRLL